MKEFLKKLETLFAAVAFTEAGKLEKARQCMTGFVALSSVCAPVEVIPGRSMPLLPEGDS